MLPASPYPGCHTMEHNNKKLESKGKEQYFYKCKYYQHQRTKAHTCEDLPFCSVGRFGFVKSLNNDGNKLINSASMKGKSQRDKSD
jgi:hypothetical protein